MAMTSHRPVPIFFTLDRIPLHGLPRSRKLLPALLLRLSTSVADTATDLVWIKSLLQELGVKLTSQPVICCDNVGATYLCANHVFDSRMKLVALDYQFIRQLVQAGILRHYKKLKK